MKRAAPATKKPEATFWILAIFLAVIAFTGGASRVDVDSLIVLRPLSVLACAVALLTLRRDDLKGREWLFLGCGALFALALLHVVPLPPSLWHMLPGRQAFAEIDRITGLGDSWRPLTLTPMNGWHALLSLFAPLAVLLLGVQLNRQDLYRLLPLLIAIGAISGLFGLLQLVGNPDGPLYLYEVTNNGSAVGLFANRNHAALLLALLPPMLALWLLLGGLDHPHHRLRLVLAVSLGILSFLLILVTGSRSALLISLVGLVIALLIYGNRSLKSGGKRVSKLALYRALGLGTAALIALIALTVYFSRAEAIKRLLGQSIENENRLEYWQISMGMFWKYFPFGSGSGSFAEAYQVAEPDYILNLFYLNHAHNDFLETGVTFGLPGLLLVAAGAFLYARRSAGLWRVQDGRSRSLLTARMAGILLLMLSIACFSDYPLRTPLLACFFAVFSLWFTEPAGDRANATPPTSRTEG